MERVILYVSDSVGTRVIDVKTQRLGLRGWYLVTRYTPSPPTSICSFVSLGWGVLSRPYLIPLGLKSSV